MISKKNGPEGWSETQAFRLRTRHDTNDSCKTRQSKGKKAKDKSRNKKTIGKARQN